MNKTLATLIVGCLSTSCIIEQTSSDHWRTYTFEEKEFYTDGNLKSLDQWNDTGPENPLDDETFTFFSEKGDTLSQRVNFYSLGKTPFHFKADSSSYGIKTQKDNLIYIEKQTGEKSLLRNELLKILPIFNSLITTKIL